MRTSSRRMRHLTSPAKPGPPKEPSRSSAPPPPPRWRGWLLLVGLAVTLLLLFEHTSTSKSPHNYNYTQFVSQVQQNHVKTASIDPNGAITGKLSDGKLLHQPDPPPL